MSRMGFYALIAFAFLACSEQRPLDTASKTTHAVGHEQVFLSQRNIELKGAWLAPETITSQTVVPSNQFIFGLRPHYYLNADGSSILMWKPINISDSTVANPASNDHKMLVKAPADAQWQALDVVAPPDSWLQSTAHDKNSGRIFAFWLATTSLLLTVYEPGIGWGQPITVDSGWDTLLTTSRFLLMTDSTFNANGDLYLLWIKKDADIADTISVASYSPQTGLSPVSQFTRSTVTERDIIRNFRFSVDNAGEVLLVWQEGFLGGPKSIWSAAMSNGQWSTPQSLLLNSMDPHVFVLSQNQLSSDAELVLIDRNVEKSVSLSYRNKAWGPETPLTIPFMYSAEDVATNNNGDIVFTWTEDIGFAPNTQESLSIIKAIRYTIDSGWVAEDIISNAFLTNMLHPGVKMNDNGNIAVAWVDSSNGIPELHVNHFDTVLGWSVQETVYSLNAGVALNSGVSLSFNDVNQISISWEEVSQDATGWIYTVKHAVHDTTNGELTPSPPITFVPPANPQGQFPSLVWATPQMIQEITVPTTDYTSVNGPFVRFDNSLSATIYSNHLTNPLPFDVNQTQVTLHVGEYDIANGYADVIVNPPTSLSSSFYIADVFSSNAGISQFMLWRSNQSEDYISANVRAQGWSPPISVGVDKVGVFKPLLDNRAVYIWQDPNISGINLQFFSATSTSLGTADRNPIEGLPASWEHIIIEASNLISIPWYQMTTGVRELVLLQYSPGTSWQRETAAVSFPINLMAHRFTNLAVSAIQNYVAIIQRQDNRHIYANVFNKVDGWSIWENVDANEGSFVLNTGWPHVLTAQSGEITIIWIQEEFDVNGQYQQGIYSSQFVETPPANGTHWTAPVKVASTNGITWNLGFVSAIDDAGNITLAWLDRVGPQSRVLVNSYNPATGWSATTEEVAIFDFAESGTPVFLDLASSPDGKLILAWSQLVFEGQTAKFAQWFTTK